MGTNWDKFDKEIDTKALAAEVKAAAENGGKGDYVEVPHGTYEVKVTKLELTTSKANNPMVSGWFKVLTGEYKGSLIFWNQVVTLPFQIGIVDEFLRSLDSGIPIEFMSYKQYDQMIMDVMEAIDGKLEYLLNYSKGKKDFSNYSIEEVFEAAAS